MTTPTPVANSLGGVPALPVPFVGSGCVASRETVRANIQGALGRGLPELTPFEFHDREMSVVGGGPSLEDTWDTITGSWIACVNRAHEYLIERGVVPHFCGLLDPQPILADQITPHEDVTYLVASMCDPSVFDKLKGHRVKLWHAGQGEHIPITDLLPDGSVVHAGGSTVALRMVELGHFLGFRRFHFYGMDSSFRGDKHHAYSYHDYETDARMQIQGYDTTTAMLVQISDISRRLPIWDEMGIQEMTVHGGGLFQHLWRQEFGGDTRNCVVPARACSEELGDQLQARPAAVSA